MIGFLNIMKPTGMTSHDVVARLRKISQVRQIGHAGTLDPEASGVLPIAIGKACRLIQYLPSDKTYLAEILLGLKTDTDDLAGAVLEKLPVQCSAQEVEAALNKFIGEITQIPPIYSAIHVNGERLYDLARKGQAPEKIPQRQVTVYSLKVIAIELPVVRVEIHCSGGTYIRSIARDLGEQLQTGGCLKSLVRKQAAEMRLEESITLDALADSAKSGAWHERLIAPNEILGWPRVELAQEQAKRLTQGQSLSLGTHGGKQSTMVFAFCNNVLLAACSTESGDQIKPEVVFAHASEIV